VKCIPIYSRIVSLFAEQNELQYAVPGGLIGVGLTVDPTLTRADRLVGQVRWGAAGFGSMGVGCGFVAVVFAALSATQNLCVLVSASDRLVGQVRWGAVAL
jgi:hypothetical protein